MSCIGENYMEYSVMTTNRCNISCRYCINRKRREIDTDRVIDVDKVIRYIKNDVDKNQYHPIVITFYGGEPLLVQPELSKIIDGTVQYNPKYILFTNGTLLNKVNLDILRSMYLISVSIDGDSTQHDRIRGQGSFDKIIHNYVTVKSSLPQTEFMAFVTVTPESRLYRSVMGLQPYFTNVFWFLENSSRTYGLDKFLTRYDTDLDRLYEYWINKLQQGEVVKFIPFQSLYDIIEQKHEYTDLPCGIGKHFQAISIDGTIYSCEDSYHHQLGHIDSGRVIPKVQDNDSFAICNTCSLKSICAGRCVVPHRYYSQQKIAFYCECSKLLINKFYTYLPQVKELVQTGVVKEQDLLNPLTRFTDVIP